MNVKIMTANVWADVFGNPVHERDERLAKVILRHKPDAVCFQEMHPHWHDCLLQPALFSEGYAPVEADLGTCALNYTPVYYRADRFTVEESGFHSYSGLNDFDSKSVTWAKLKNKETGEVFAVMATHFYYEGNERGNLARIGNVRELIECAENICAAGPLPVFIGGDFNCDLFSEPLQILEKSGFKSSVQLTEVRENPIATWYGEPVYHPDTASYTPAPLSNADYRYSLDHIFVNDRVRVGKHTVDISEDGRIVSDHRPVIVTAEI